MFGYGWNQGGGKNDGDFGTILAFVAGLGLLGLGGKRAFEWGEKKVDEAFSDVGQAEATTQVVEASGTAPDPFLTTWLPLAGTLAVGVAVEESLRAYYRKKAKERMEYFQIIPHAETSVNHERMKNLIYSFHQMNRTVLDRITKGREWFQLYFVCVEDATRGDEGRIEIYCGFPRDRFTYVKKKLIQAFPQCGLKRTHWTKVPTLAKKGHGGYIRYADSNKSGFPLDGFKGKDQISGILEQLQPGSALSVTFSPTTPRKLKQALKQTRKAYYQSVGFNPKEMKKFELDPDIKHELDQLDARARNNRAFEVKIAIWQEAESYGDTVSSLRDELNSRLAGENNGFYLKPLLRNPIQMAPYSLGYFDFLVNWLDRVPYVPVQAPMVWLAMELASLLHLPEGMTEEQRARKARHLYNRIDHITSGQTEIPHDQFTEGVHIGNLLNPVQDYRPIHLLEDVMRKMGVVIGKIGGGKTAIALMACIDVIMDRLQRKNGGLTVIDPKEDFVYTILTYLNKLKIEGKLTEEQESLFRFYDVTSEEYCFSINPMQKTSNNMTETEKMEIVNNTLEVLISTYPHDSILFEKYCSVAIRALLEDTQMEHTILAIPEFIDKESPLRDRLYNTLKHGTVEQQDIAREIQRLSKGFGGTDTQTVYNRLLRLKNSPRMKRIFGQSKTSIHPLENMEKGIITLFNVEGLKEHEMKLVIGYIAMEYHKGSNQRKNKAQNHYLWIDEAHEVQIPVLWEKIIPKDRAMGLCLWLLTQSFEQFNDKLLKALTDVGGNFISCIAGRDSAKKVQEITTGRVKATDIQNYRALTASIDTEDQTGDRVTFMVKVDPPYVWDAEGKSTYYGSDKQKRDDAKNAAYKNAWKKLGEKWMARDCRPVTEVEQEIAEYMQSLWNRKKKVTLEQSTQEAAATKEAFSQADNKVVDFQTKKAVGENHPFAHLNESNESGEEEENQ